MKKVFAVLAGISALALATPANASAVITAGSTFNVPDNNDFKADLHALGLDAYTSTGATLSLDAPATLTFEYLAGEHGFTDTFTAAGSTMSGAFGPSGFACSGSSCTNQPGIENHFGSPIMMGSGVYGAGSLWSLLGFTSDHGNAAGVGDFGFGIFLPVIDVPSFVAAGPFVPSPYVTNVFYLGYDDFGAGPDDNHDDFILRVTVGDPPPAPEPATWAMMLLGFGAMGVAIRRTRKSTPLAQIA